MKISDRVYCKASYDLSPQVDFAYCLGLLWGKFPEWADGVVEAGRSWRKPYDAQLELSIISDTADSWHEPYRQLRELGWKRYYVSREGGVITYGLKHEDESRPTDFRIIKLHLLITLSTCRQVKTGTKEVDVFETVCDDIQEPADDSSLAPSEDESSFVTAAEEESDDIPVSELQNI